MYSEVEGNVRMAKVIQTPTHLPMILDWQLINSGFLSVSSAGRCGGGSGRRYIFSPGLYWLPTGQRHFQTTNRTLQNPGKDIERTNDIHL